LNNIVKVKTMNRYLLLAINMVLLVLLAGCAASPILELRESRMPSGTYYEVQRGDTLWRISKLYNVGIERIIRANRLPDASTINVGQRLFIPKIGRIDKYPEDSRTVEATGKFLWPTSGKVISHFGSKQGLATNKGIDIEAREGSKVVAADSGIISFVDENMKGLGKTVILDHKNGFSTVYAHNSEILVRVGQKIKRNQQIAKVGKTGRAEKPYLHFQIRKGHEPQNPFYYLP